MRVEFKFRGVVPSDELRTLARKRLEFALDRFVDDVRSITVQLSDLNGPKGGVDKRCHLTLKARGVGTITTYQDSADFESAIDLAFGVARRTLARELEAQREHRRLRLFRWRFS